VTFQKYPEPERSSNHEDVKARFCEAMGSLAEGGGTWQMSVLSMVASLFNLNNSRAEVAACLRAPLPTPQSMQVCAAELEESPYRLLQQAGSEDDGLKMLFEALKALGLYGEPQLMKISEENRPPGR